MAYTTSDTLLLGDMQVSSGIDKDAYVKDAADEIDSVLGHIYATPINTGTVARHSALLLKRINMLIATGRLVLALNSGQSDHLHAYGTSMLAEGLEWLRRLVDREILIDGAVDAPGPVNSQPSGPQIINADEYSAVDAFYNRVMRPQSGSTAELDWAPGSSSEPAPVLVPSPAGIEDGGIPGVAP